MKPALREQITQLGLDYRLMTQFTSFVAVEEKIVTKDGKPQRVEVPVEMPEGVSHEGVFGRQDQDAMYRLSAGQGAAAGLALGLREQGLARKAASPGVATQTVEVQTDKSRSNVPTRGSSPTAPLPPPAPTKMGATPAMIGPNDNEVVDVTTPEQRSKDRHILESKLQSAVLAALDCFRKPAGANSKCANVNAGKIAVQIWLTADSASLREQLRVVGFEMSKDHPSQKMLAGNLAVEKLEALANLSAVQFISLERR
jgi:hypothetical protein